jgi:hypothetical protein
MDRWILRRVDSERYGGRTFCTEEGTVVLYDCGAWTDGHTHAVQAKYPGCEVVITHNSASLSGFIVVFTHRDTSALSWILAAAMGVALLLLTFRQILK